MTLSLVVNSWRLKRLQVKSLRETLAARTSSEQRLLRQTRCLKLLVSADRSTLSAAMTQVRQASRDSKDFENVTLLLSTTHIPTDYRPIYARLILKWKCAWIPRSAIFVLYI